MEGMAAFAIENILKDDKDFQKLSYHVLWGLIFFCISSAKKVWVKTSPRQYMKN